MRTLPCFACIRPSHAARRRESLSTLRFRPQRSASPGPSPCARAQVAAGGQSLAEQALTDRLLLMLSAVEAAPSHLTVESALQQPPPRLQDDDSRLPLTW